MSNVWVTIPSARPVDQVEAWAKAWKERGYKIALWVDSEAHYEALDSVNALIYYNSEGYPGYAVSVNQLVKLVLVADPTAEWFVIGGDDVFPDPNHTAEEIAAQCREHFAVAPLHKMFPGGFDEVPAHLKPNWEGIKANATKIKCATFGVMQPTGDRWGENPNHPRPDMRSAYIDRIAGSAWFGREYCRRVNQGKGPLWPEYQHMFVDSEAMDVAVRLGVYWQRRDLIQEHRHAGRVKNYTTDMIPEHLKKWTVGEAGRKHWKESEALYFSRRDAGFPGSEPL